ncbi:hypothetical protein EBN03_10190 [Nocardia stercoris]|uniref:Lysozyme n=2 Tax=Nocardia stercoris TaxID=2483361 RepID=A0A3M2L9W2_9NOCA|nr:hypothetical protein EBN03_10190 [Nocardia stercoris]
MVAAAAAAAEVTAVLAAGPASATQHGAFDVGGAIEVDYNNLGGPDVLGDPITPESPAANGGRFQKFTNNASIYWTPATGATEVGGRIRDKWASTNYENGPLGYPVTDEQGTPNGEGRYNHFQNGSIYWSLGTDAHVVSGPIRDKWAQMGWEGGILGFPVTDAAKAGSDGLYQIFDGGTVYWSPKTGAHTVWGAIKQNWQSYGDVNGRYGFPTSDEYDYKDGKAQDFQGGKLTWQP